MKRVSFLAPPKAVAGDWDGWTPVAFEKALGAIGIPAKAQRFRFIGALGRVLRRGRLVRNLLPMSPTAYMVTLAHVSEYKIFPATYFHEIIPYCYDCWPPRYGEWAGLFRRHEMKTVFFSSQQSCEHFKAEFPGIRCFWVPEACDITSYRGEKSLHERTIDVLEFGRKYDPYHEAIATRLEDRGRRYLWTAAKLSRDDFISAIGDAKISIAFPRSVTNPQFACGLETVTLRYFETMASKSVMVGHCPKELIDLIGYNPVIEADLNRPFEQLEEILASIDDYQKLVERNYQTVAELGTWDCRATQMGRILRDLGYVW